MSSSTENIIKRVRVLRDTPYQKGGVVYYCVRDQRVEQNPALLFAQSLALKYKVPLSVLFVLYPSYLGATQRQYDFMFRGLKEMEQYLRERNIPLVIRFGSDAEELDAYIKENTIGIVVTDFSPLKRNREWKEIWASTASIPVYEVDARNIIPAWKVTNKQEYGAYTIRPKIHALLPEYLHTFPKLRTMQDGNLLFPAINWDRVEGRFMFKATPKVVEWIVPGERAGQEMLTAFIKNSLEGYAERRNDPNISAQSNLSPYITFGQISRHQIAVSVMQSSAPQQDKDAYLEELIVRSELAENFCFFNPKYDSFDAFPEWAKKTLNAHRDDPREYVYTQQQFEQAETHDDLWNAAQQELLQTGKMHGYMRMYWAKKILEWTKSPEEAMEIAIYLNDTYELDGREPNGYAGIAWSIGGVHDRAWFSRPIFGTIRFMSASGAASKFNIAQYIYRWTGKTYDKKTTKKNIKRED